MSDLDADALRERLSGEQMIHRLRDWTDGDTLYGVQFIQPDSGAAMGKTYQKGGEYGEDSAEQMARDHYTSGFPHSGVSVLYRATVRDPRTEPPGPDPGEPPLKFGTLTDVEILDWKQNNTEGGGGDD